MGIRKNLKIYLETDKITDKQLDELDAFLIKLFDTEDIIITTDSTYKIQKK